MLRLDRNNFSNEFTLLVWFLMAFQAGYVNVGGFLTSGNFVSHVTGTSSQIGMTSANSDISILFVFAVCLMAFISGSALSGFFIGRKMEKGENPKYIPVLLIKSIMFGTVVYLTSVEWTHDLDPVVHPINILTVFLLSFCCGVQNATCAQATNGFLKPTHMTGLSTDIGMNLGRIKGIKEEETKKEEMRKNRLRMGILASFIIGGAVATIIFSKYKELGFLFPFFSSVCFLLIGFIRDENDVVQNKWALESIKSSLVVILITTFVFVFI